MHLVNMDLSQIRLFKCILYIIKVGVHNIPLIFWLIFLILIFQIFEFFLSALLFNVWVFKNCFSKILQTTVLLFCSLTMLNLLHCKHYFCYLVVPVSFKFLYLFVLFSLTLNAFFKDQDPKSVNLPREESSNLCL